MELWQKLFLIALPFAVLALAALLYVAMRRSSRRPADRARATPHAGTGQSPRRSRNTNSS